MSCPIFDSCNNIIPVPESPLYQTLKNCSPFFVLAGPNVIEQECPERCVKIALEMKEICKRQNMPYVFKTSFDKANRSSLTSYRGPPIKQSLEVFSRIKKLDIPVVTDVHETWQVELVAPHVDILQIPAFLCRQTDLLRKAAESGKIIHIKKGQFATPEMLHAAADKVRACGNPQILLCERGNTWGYGDLIVDPRNLVALRHPCREHLVTMDITHSLQKPGQGSSDKTLICSGGARDLIPTIARTAVAVGVDGIFMEVHDDPESSPCDGPTQWPLHQAEPLLAELANIAKASLGKITHYV